MRILGQHSDEVGSQLERLTRRILERLQYTGIQISKTDASGELDVVAERVMDGIDGKNSYPIMCECKARADVLNMTDWLKFLGKLYVQDVLQNRSVAGCLIAINGVNGNVAGSYEAVKKSRQITLVTDEALLKHLAELYDMATLPNMRSKVMSEVNDFFLSAEIVLY